MAVEHLRRELRARLERALRDQRTIVLAEYWQIVALAEAIAHLENVVAIGDIMSDFNIMGTNEVFAQLPPADLYDLYERSYDLLCRTHAEDDRETIAELRGVLAERMRGGGK